MSPAATLESLFQQVQAMHGCLACDDAVGTGRLLSLHDQHLRQFLSDPAAAAANALALGELLAAQRGVTEMLVAAREGARRQMQVTRRNGEATHAYLANTGA